MTPTEQHAVSVSPGMKATCSLPALRLVFVLTVGLCASLSAQNDAGMWASYSLSAPVTKRFELAASPELRLDENLSRVQSAFVDLSAQRQLNKYFFVTGDYRVGSRNRDQVAVFRQRFSLGLGLKYTPGDFRLAWLCRMQSSQSAGRSESDPDFATTLRNKFSLKFNGLKKTDLSTSFEFFNQAGAYGDLRLTDWRWQCALERRVFNKRNSVSLGYLIQRNLQDRVMGLDFVVLVGYRFETSVLKKKKAGTEAAPAGQ